MGAVKVQIKILELSVAGCDFETYYTDPTIFNCLLLGSEVNECFSQQIVLICCESLPVRT